jgi:hypothetical protein
MTLVKFVSASSLRDGCTPPLAPGLEQPEEVADAAALREHPWRYIVLITLADIIDLAAAGATTAELHEHVNAVIAAAEQRLAGAPLQWGES